MEVIPAAAGEEYRRATVHLQVAAAVAVAVVATEVVDLPRHTEHPVEVVVAVEHHPLAMVHLRPPAMVHHRPRVMEHRPAAAAAAAAAAAVSEVVASAVEHLPAVMEHHPPAAMEHHLPAVMEHLALVEVEVSAAGHRPPVTELHLVPPAATGHHP